MKKHILSICLMLLCASYVSAQVAFSIDPPSDNAGGFIMTWGDDATWSGPDLNDPANVLQGTLCLGIDSLACEPLTNGVDLVGKIAVVYRGACEFGAKALACQNEGAIGCVIINNAGDPVGMAGGTFGLDVTIPVIMISTAAGVQLYDEIASCNVQATIGNLNGFYANNLRITPGGINRPDAYGQIAALNADASEFSIDAGAWAFNFGTEDEPAAVLGMTVSLDGTSLYDEFSDPVAIPAGDSIYMTLPAFSQASYPFGFYETTYTISGNTEDQFTGDNAQIANFKMGNSFSYGRLGDDDRADAITSFRQTELIGEGHYCIYFSDPNASRVVVNSFDFTGTNFDGVVDDIDMEAVVYVWEDEFAGLETTLTEFDEVDSEGYTFTTGDDDQTITLDFTNPIELEDGDNYLFCVRHENPELAFGYDNQTNYTQTQFLSQTPINPSWDESASFINGFGLDAIPAISVGMTSVVGLDEAREQVELTPFPNPANETLSIPFKNDMKGAAVLRIFDVQGKLVSNQRLNLTGGILEVSVTAIANGSYDFNLLLEDNQESNFKVLINR